ncbi:HAD family phosphatase [Halovulum dunhuangense]|uniref:HAD family phosphatase n=1 Tax=Halovulum dunhuangense TaxID=1505036 RepID=A0A849KV78_9RHOB|nr:HAD family phosphatase [Halovulum dunhuangense]NNU79278.1 HAD family phosphatase [Halovulum dunhuangense]
MARRPEAIVFDIGNVLIEWNPERVFDEIMGSRAAREELFATVDLHGMNDRIDRGAPFRETVHAEAARHPRFRAQIEQWHTRWLDMASPAIEGSWRILRTLRSQGVPVFALSNFGIQTFALAEGVYPILNEFDRRYLSGQMKVIKPDPRIYEMVEQDCGLSGAQLFFTDDRADNIAAADARGWQTHRFTNPEALAGALRARGFPL